MKKINKYLTPYHWNINGFYKRCYEKPLNFILNEFSPEDTVLDIGCGDGKLTSIITSRVKKVIGIDNQELPIKYAKLIFNKLEIRNVNFFVKDILEFKSNFKFDKIVCFDVIEHLSDDEIEKLIKIMASLLKENGKIYLTTPNRKSFSNRIFGHKLIDKHYYEYDIKELKKLFEEHFSNLKFNGIYFPLFPKTGRYPDVFPFCYFFNFLINLGDKFPSLSHTILLGANKK